MMMGEAEKVSNLSPLEAELLGALKSISPIMREIHDKWDEGMRAGKLIVALQSPKMNYRADISAIHSAIAKADAAALSGGTFQSRIQPWMLACFGEMIAGDREERNHRFLEEALELVQSTGCSESEAHQLVDYVYGRAVGEPSQEVGGVMVTLAALCLANKIDMHDAGEVELARIWTKVEQIRAKQAGKPKHSPLPGPPEPAR